MSEAHRSDLADVDAAASEVGRDAKIEQLLLVGLDHYFASRYELAINVWTRVLFLDRSHARARAYIERARSAQAERQRESEELLHNGLSAFQRGESGEARRLLEAAIEGGAPSEDALAILERVNRLETAAAHGTRDGDLRARLPIAEGRRQPARASVRGAVAAIAVLAVGLLAYAVSTRRLDWQSLLALTGAEPLPTATTGVPARPETMLALPHRGEMMLTRARALSASGHLREALSALRSVRSTDPQKPEADRLSADLQRQLLALTDVPAGSDREQEDRRVP
jgi:tetratricopeptide (TPR) repeat protein